MTQIGMHKLCGVAINDFISPLIFDGKVNFSAFSVTSSWL